MYKTDYCGDLRASDEGREITLAGWVHRRRDHGGLIFIDLRDSRGLVQVVFSPDEPAAHAVASDARGEYVLRVRGRVQRRRAGTENANLATGAIEVRAASAELLNAAKTPPFYINEDSDVDEQLRLKYRYLDLRRDRMQRNLRLRAVVTRVFSPEWVGTLSVSQERKNYRVRSVPAIAVAERDDLVTAAGSVVYQATPHLAVTGNLTYRHQDSNDPRLDFTDWVTQLGVSVGF